MGVPLPPSRHDVVISLKDAELPSGDLDWMATDSARERDGAESHGAIDFTVDWSDRGRVGVTFKAAIEQLPRKTKKAVLKFADGRRLGRRERSRLLSVWVRVVSAESS